MFALRCVGKIAGLSVVVLLIGASSCRAVEPAKDRGVDFSRDIRPILSDKCFQCHGPDEEAREADLRLDRRADAQSVLSPDAPGDSELSRRVTSDDPDERMPPADSKIVLTADEIELLTQWIAEGSPYEQHWSFSPITAVVPPALDKSDWPRNEIDRFILARIEREGLAPSPEARKVRLIRRLSFDLTGLPPSIEEIDQFRADESEDTYEKLVDRLLAKQSHGERMASDWLDVARYSDTYGYQVDRDRFVWPWRDWVIKAFNENMPYDEFITSQLAGDLLPEATDSQLLATTFDRLHPQKVEGGTVPEEFRVEYVADRTHTFATAFLGLTLECARCHDHKFDPITQKEYYQLFAFFNNIDEAGLYSYSTSAVPTPTLLLGDDKKKAQIAEIESRTTGAEQELPSIAERRREAFRKWLEERPAEPVIPGQIAHLDFEELEGENNRSVPGHVGNAVLLTGDDAIGLEVGNFRRFEPFSVSLWMNTPNVKSRAVVFHRSGGWTDAGSRGYQLLIEDGKLSASLIHFWPGNAIRVKTSQPIPTASWLHVVVTSDGSSRAEGLRIFLNGQPADSEVIRDNLFKNITGGGGDNLAIGARNRDRGFSNGLIDEFQVFDRQLTAIEIAHLHDGKSLKVALVTPVQDLSDVDWAALLEYFLATIDAPYQEQLATLKGIRNELSETVEGVSEIMVMREREKTRPTHLLKRGAYNAPGTLVHADTPALFPPFPEGEPRNRLGLARWLTDPAHPLTARVAVNRYWQMCFGQGLVRTPEDFGSQGSSPTHPELLDWLARDLMENGWDVNRLLKMMVTSATYRQSSQASPELLARDEDNRLLARAPRHRLDAEMIRDNALATSGLLVTKIGGPSVRPYEVAVSFKPVDRDQGDGLYRRSLYTYWKRTAPAPVMMSFDASKRDVCTVKRERTSSPLQALVLLNDPQFVEAAQMLAARVLRKHAMSIDATVEEMFVVLTSRRPSSDEQTILRALYDEQLGYFTEDVSRAEEFLKVSAAGRDDSIPAAPLAAASVVAATLLNFDECVMKR